MHVGQKSFQPQGKYAHSTEEGGNHDDVHQVVADVVGLPQVVAGGVEIEPVHTHHLEQHSHHQENDGRNGQQDGQFLGITDHSGQGLGGRILDDRGRTHRCQYVTGLGAAGAQGGAIAAVVAQPDVAVADQPVLQPPGCGDHFLSGKGLGIRRDGAGHGAGGALIALFNIGTPQSAHFFDKTHIGIDQI